MKDRIIYASNERIIIRGNNNTIITENNDSYNMSGYKSIRDFENIKDFYKSIARKIYDEHLGMGDEIFCRFTPDLKYVLLITEYAGGGFWIGSDIYKLKHNIGISYDEAIKLNSRGIERLVFNEWKDVNNKTIDLDDYTDFYWWTDSGNNKLTKYYDDGNPSFWTTPKQREFYETTENYFEAMLGVV